MPQIQILDFKSATRLEPVPEKRNEQAQQAKHCMDDAPIPPYLAKPA
jgi:hypothetical protein